MSEGGPFGALRGGERRTMTLQQLLKEGTGLLAEAGVAEAELDARRLLLEAFEMDEAHFLLERMRPFEENESAKAQGTSARDAFAAAGENGKDPGAQTARYRDMLAKRARRIPLQYILGRQEFMGLTFAVDSRVLIPRQDTETLVETILQEQKDRKKKVLDLCTGSGCIAVSLAVLGGYEDVSAADLSPDALAVAERNARALLPEGRKIIGYARRGDDMSREDGPRFRLFLGDMFQALPAGERYDILVSNPPYIPTEVIGGLQPEVCGHEPRMALDGDSDGLAFYRRIASEATARLNPGGTVYLEIGCGQADAVRELLEAAGFAGIKVYKDLPGLDRVVRGVLG